MSNPSLARSDDDDRRFYVFGDPVESFWSVTTIINAGVRKYLEAHYAKLAAELAYDALLERGPYSRPGAIIRRLAARGRANVVDRQARGELTSIKLHKLTERDLALRWVKGAADRHRDAAAARGSDVHGQAEQFVLKHARESTRLLLEGVELDPWPEEIRGWQPGYVSWINRFQPEFLAAEVTVFNRPQAYGGTLDTIVRLTFTEEARWALSEMFPVLLERAYLDVIVDYKTGNDVYAEVGLQLAPYARAQFIGHPDGRTELPMPHVDAGAVLHLRQDGTHRFRFVRIDDPIFETFLYAREMLRFQLELAKTVFLGDVPAVLLEAVA